MITLPSRASKFLLGGVAVAAALLAGVQLAGAGPAAPASAASVPEAYRTANWDELMPKDWNPLKKFRDAKINIMSDADPRAQDMLTELRALWDNAPTNNELDGQAIRMPGYVVPLDESKAGLREFLLVPYLGACIHTPPPPANQIIHVKLRQPGKGLHMMDAVWVSGRLQTLRTDTAMGVSGYRMEAVQVEPYKER